MPCIKCSNGKYKYGQRGDCIFDTLGKCKAAAVAINISDPGPHGPIPQKGANMIQPVQPVQPTNPMHDPTCQCAGCKGLYPKYPMK